MKKNAPGKPSGDEGWDRFERAVDAAVKSGPKPRTGKVSGALFTPSERAEAVSIAVRQFAAEGLEVRLSEDGSLQVSTPSLKEWLGRHSA